MNVALTRSKFKRIIIGDISKAGKDLGGILNDGYTLNGKIKKMGNQHNFYVVKFYDA